MHLFFVFGSRLATEENEKLASELRTLCATQSVCFVSMGGRGLLEPEVHVGYDMPEAPVASGSSKIRDLISDVEKGDVSLLGLNQKIIHGRKGQTNPAFAAVSSP